MSVKCWRRVEKMTRVEDFLDVEKLQKWVKTQVKEAERLNREAGELSFEIEKLREEIRQIGRGKHEFYACLNAADRGETVQVSNVASFDKAAGTDFKTRFQAEALIFYPGNDRETYTVGVSVRDRDDFKTIWLEKWDRKKLINIFEKALSIEDLRRRIEDLRRKREEKCRERNAIFEGLRRLRDEINAAASLGPRIL
ncbi:MAG: hypothetical protein QXZ66_09320 [Thermoproteota archaeon]